MSSRNFKLDWSRTFGELITIIVGVLIALGVDQWNDDRLERAEEEIAIDGIIAELKEDLSRFEFRLRALDAKTASLLRVQDALSQRSVVDGDGNAFLHDVIVGANFGWNQGLASRATYDDLISSGKLAIIEEPEVRLAIAAYYDHYDDEHRRIEERETRYPDLSYRLVPRQIDTRDDLTVFESGPQAGLSEQRISHLVSQVLVSPLRDYVTAEINLALFIQSITKAMQVRAQLLIDQLDEYQASN